MSAPQKPAKSACEHSWVKVPPGITLKSGAKWFCLFCKAEKLPKRRFP